MRQNTGFTLIELIMVISILGILAAVAVPKFVNLGGDARAASVRSWAGAIRSAMGMAHSTFLATGGGTVTVDGVTITMAGAYPAASAVGIGRALANTDASDLTTSYAGTTAVFSPASAPDSGAHCRISYDTSATPPTITIDVAAC